MRYQIEFWVVYIFLCLTYYLKGFPQNQTLLLFFFIYPLTIKISAMFLKNKSKDRTWIVLPFMYLIWSFFIPFEILLFFILLSKEIYRSKRAYENIIFNISFIPIALYKLIAQDYTVFLIVAFYLILDVLRIKGTSSHFSDCTKKLIESTSVTDALLRFSRIVKAQYYPKQLSFIITYKNQTYYYKYKNRELQFSKYEDTNTIAAISYPLSKSLESSKLIHLQALYEGYPLNSRDAERLDVLSQLLESLLLKHLTEKEFQREIYIDHLTKVYNRKFLNKRLACITPGTALAFFDLDKFKNINDQFGHEIGDKVLVIFAKTVMRSIRPNDIFGRWGGEEFVLVLQNVEDREHLFQIVDRIRQNVEQIEPESVGVINRRITVSIGVVIYSRGSHIDAIKNADKAMYEAKKERNKVVIL